MIEAKASGEVFSAQVTLRRWARDGRLDRSPALLAVRAYSEQLMEVVEAVPRLVALDVNSETRYYAMG